MEAVCPDEHRREQVEHYCAMTWYFLHAGDEGCEVPAGMNRATVEWRDVAEWDVPNPRENQQ